MMNLQAALLCKAKVREKKKETQRGKTRVPKTEGEELSEQAIGIKAEWLIKGGRGLLNRFEQHGNRTRFHKGRSGRACAEYGHDCGAQAVVERKSSGRANGWKCQQ